jgi:hypothetical protein
MYKDINEFKKDYQSHAYVVKKYGSTIVADTITIQSRWEQFYSSLLNISQSRSPEGCEIDIAEPDIINPSLIGRIFHSDIKI